VRVSIISQPESHQPREYGFGRKSVKPVATVEEEPGCTGTRPFAATSFPHVQVRRA
jgi:hypothetical protein